MTTLAHALLAAALLIIPSSVLAQRPAPEASPELSISRCSAESGETQSGGNGVSGHDETSENLTATFKLTTKTPGAPNTCP